MTQHHIAGRALRRSRVLAAALSIAALAPALVVGTAAPAAAAAPAVSCTAKTAGLAAKLKKDIDAALKGRKGAVAIYFNDVAGKSSCTLRPTQKFDSASVVKATVLGALLVDAQNGKRALTAREKTLATAMITKSDNASTTTLWKQLGMTKIKRFLTSAGMKETTAGANGYWGLTQITARDQQILLSRLTTKNTLLTDASRTYALKLMRDVVSSQRWGTPAGAPTTATVQLKNGWLSRSTHAWRVHSIGAFTGKGHDYTITVLTHGNKTMNDGVNTIQAVSRAIHKAVNPTAKRSFAPPAVPHEAVPATPERAAKEAIPASPSLR
ncbi:serine hydrolase [Streptomyces albipurpureus]|uniref:Class A beta-lactamase-related serine hydrolase n=1 Tax=Streptomyces albipurpureus TaxID=2897419 RepID=A0ABT0UUQ8_9ACTN|nr:serine hydrolase [Streptomyces sp. CWNU-1]MCM2392132.1 class A beta-lactamase-related serine hydrolase [Streptomyces sp. CWNU-1]